MKKILLFLFLLSSLSLFSQPANDDCGGIIDLGTAPFCEGTTVYHNVGATPSDIGNDNAPACFVGAAERDVWFSFVSSDTILDYTISIIGCPDPVSGALPIINPEIAIYRGDVCAFDELVLLDCASSSSDPGTNEVTFNPPALTPGIRYFVRVNDWSSTTVPNSGGFKVCVTDQVQVVTVDEGGSTACSGEIFDTGGESNNYGDNENHVYTICPTQEHSCLRFDMEFFNIEPFEDQIIFYDGPNVSSPQIEVIGNTILDVPDDGVTGGGAVCFSLTATSGCLTIQFISNSSANFEGFHGFWNCLQEPCETLEQLEVQDNISEQTIIDRIADSQMTVTIDTIICAPTQFGVFTADDTDLGLGEGLILTTGHIANAIGPNDGPDTFLEQVGSPGDIDLDTLSPLFDSQDACIVELDVFVPTDELTFEYIFGSEEYTEFVDEGFNDIFAFLVSGPGITGLPELSGQENIALIPGTNTPVEINSVNNLRNWEYYRSNEINAFNPLSPAGKSIEYNGLTSDFLGGKKSLTARKKVTPCETYHLKLAIADRGDNSYDSGVFISEISGGTPSLDISYFSGIDYLVEDCTVIPDQLVISIPLPETEPVTYDLEVTGTATLGVDYNLNLPATITFNPGETEFLFPIQPISDMIEEGTETIEIRMSRDFGCGSFTYSVLIIELRDDLLVEVNAGRDTAFVCQNGSRQLEASGANQYVWTPSALFDNNQVSNPTVTPLVSGWVEVEGSLGICFDKDSIWLEIIDPQMDIAVLGDTTFCAGDSVMLRADNNIANSNLVWTPSVGIVDVNFPLVNAMPTDPTLYIATVSLAGCSASDSVFVDVDQFDFPAITTLDTTICQNQSVQLAELINNTTTVYNWSPADGLDQTDVSGPIATPESSTMYTLQATSASGYCSETANINIEVLPINVEITTGDSTFICLGESIVLNSETTTAGVGQTWSPTTDLTLIDNETVEVSPPVTTTYIANLVVGDCTHEDSIVVVVDSLPMLPILQIPNRPFHCLGDTITLLSNNYDPNLFPNLEFEWMPPVGRITPATNPNVLIEVTAPTTYTRALTNRACEGEDEITIELAEDFTLQTDGDQSTCPDEEVTLSATASIMEVDFTWTENGIEIGEGATITVAPSETTVYEVVASDVADCNSYTETITVEVATPFVVDSISVIEANGNIGNVECIIKGQQISLSVDTDPMELNNPTYVWLDENGTSFQTTTEPSTAPFDIPSFEGERTLEYSVQITDADGCEVSATIEILFKDDLTVSIPNIFTPDDNGVNDRFKLLTNGQSSLNIVEFKVYNRWGQLVYDDPNNQEGWDGTQNGELAPSDVYIYRIVYQLAGNVEQVVEVGEVNLIR